MATTTALVPFKEMDAEQIALVKRTVAVGATDDELALFFFDCQRRGVHPLDKLLYFTKRKGKYTPITSIDFLRTRAHETGKCAGITDPLCVGEARKPGFAATVTVRRLVDGHVAEFTATARWEEYKPQENDFMWTRMPFTMLGKCAEALALRKAFPQELAGLYTGDEMAQAGVTAPTAETVNTVTGEIVEATQPPAAPEPSNAVPAPAKATQEPPATYTGLVTVLAVDTSGKKPVYPFNIDGQVMSTLDGGLAIQVGEYEGKHATVTYRTTAKGGYLILGVQPAVIEKELTAEELAF